jgi:hypothetical protein
MNASCEAFTATFAASSASSTTWSAWPGEKSERFKSANPRHGRSSGVTVWGATQARRYDKP